MKQNRIFSRVIAISVMLTCASCAESSPPAKFDMTVSSVAKMDTYAIRATDNAWPKTQTGVTLADNLLTQNYYLVFDGSGSMAGVQCSNNVSKMDAAKAAVSQFVLQIAASANIGLYIFDSEGMSERVPLGLHAKDTIVDVVKGSQLGGGTPLKLAVEQGYKALSEQAAKQLGYGEYNLVIITDGEASPGYDPRSAVNTILASSPIVVHTIGFCISGKHSLNQQGYTFYKAANDPASLAKGLSDVLAEVQDFSVTEFKGP